jgi:hypothetical protein
MHILRNLRAHLILAFYREFLWTLALGGARKQIINALSNASVVMHMMSWSLCLSLSDKQGKAGERQVLLPKHYQVSASHTHVVPQ